MGRKSTGFPTLLSHPKQQSLIRFMPRWEGWDTIPPREPMDLMPNFSYDRAHFHKKNGIFPHKLPVIVMRVTAYGDDGQMIGVEEVPYYNNAKSLETFRTHLLTVIEVGFEVSIVTTCEIGKIVKLLDFANR